VLLPVTVVLSIGCGGLAPMHICVFEVGKLCCVFDQTSRNCLVRPPYICIPSILYSIWLLPDLPRTQERYLVFPPSGCGISMQFIPDIVGQLLLYSF